MKKQQLEKSIGSLSGLIFFILFGLTSSMQALTPTYEKAQSSICGNGILESNEGCDDGNTLSDDGCSATCLIQTQEAGGNCNTNTNGLTGDASCESGLCDSVINACVDSICGNGILEYDEGCDDGNTVEGDGCSQICLIETTQPSTACNTDANGTIGDRSCESYYCDLVTGTCKEMPLVDIYQIDGKRNNPIFTTNNMPEIYGYCQVDKSITVTVYIDDIAITPTVACEYSDFSIIPDSAIADGVHNVTIRAIDSAGEVINTDPVVLVINTVSPNYSIKSSARGSNIFTPQAQTRVVLTIVEKKGGINSSPLRVQLPKDNKFSLHYDSSLGSLNSKILDNSNWKVTEENEDKIILSYTGNNGIFNPHGSSIIGLEVDIKTPLNSDGMLNYQSLILPESGEDYVLDRGDNSDYSSISYRNYNY